MKNKIRKSRFAVLILSLYLYLVSCSNGSSGHVPSLSPPGGAYLKLAAGTAHSCAINPSSQLKCWGRNQFGQLGDGTTVDQTTSKIIDGASGYVEVSAGDMHTCAITTGGVLKCWGRNNSSQLGDGTTVDQLTPITVDAGTLYSQISVSGSLSCGITTAGVLKCWGMNAYGGLGDGTIINKSTPTVINAGTNYLKISTGALHTCGITTGNVLKCWGLNDSGQLGDGTTVNKILPVVIDSGTTYSKIAVSSFVFYHTCGITTANVLKCWGNNNYGQIGDGTSGVARALPVVISAGIGFSDISIGYVHTCAVAFATTQLYCWGYNFFSQLGDYTSTNRSTPVQADTGFFYSKVVASNNYTCGLTTGTNLRCWGRNDYGQLGDGSVVDRYSPIGINSVSLKEF
jgi:alpha-tubulin suppressor-like RCC1 family protein